jgi:hypothetical protein
MYTVVENSKTKQDSSVGGDTEKTTVSGDSG